MFTIKTYNAISPKGLDLLTAANYQVDASANEPDAILLRSHVLQASDVPVNTKAVARAGAGVNNVPVASLSKRGIPVFNTPGANANAVKELILVALLLAARHICQAWAYTQTLSGDKDHFHQNVEQNKKQFKGVELQGRTIGVIGLGAIGVKVANAARAIGMHVMGFDPGISVQQAWELSADVKQAANLDELLKHCEFVTVHVPLNTHTKGLINQDALNKLNKHSVLLNFSREEVVEEDAVLAALEQEKLRCYVSDFPSPALHNHKNVITLPHLGASTKEAEDNCAIMAAQQLREFLEHGHIINSVNFPNVKIPRQGQCRLMIANQNIPNMVAQISNELGREQLNIINMINKSKDDLAYTIIDVDTQVSQALLDNLANIEGVLNIRTLT